MSETLSDVSSTSAHVIALLDKAFRQPCIHLDIKPKPKARPRVTRRGITYMPPDYVQFCRRLGEMFEAAGGEVFLGAPEQAVVMVMEFGMPVPKAMSRVKRRDIVGTPHALKRGDTDNLAGAVMDSILPKEDGGDHRVSHVFAWKVWAESAYIRLWLLPIESRATERDVNADPS